MARPYAIAIHFLTFLSVWASGSTTDGRLFLEELREHLQQLKANYNTLKINLEGKVSRLEEVVKRKDLQHEILEGRVLRLELELLAISEKKTNQFATKSAMFRTCSEARTADPSLTSGMYWIDPDGQGIGDDPIHVNCDMTTGKTSILHDSEAPIDVGHCADPGCYSRHINYTATMRQMLTLIELSSECHQSIKYDCNYAPFETNGVTYSWWNDRYGNPQYFWAGSNSSVHTCQCGIDGNCIDSIVNCNCDATVPLLLGDNGVITDKTILPITKLNFGRTQLSSSSGVHTLGRFECSGETTVTRMPTSCEDLWRIGHTLSGLYFVMEEELVKNVYCDFSKLSSDAGFQSLIGYTEVKPKPTYAGIPTSCEDLWRIGHTLSGLYFVMEGELVKNNYCDFTKLPGDTGFQSLIGYTEVKPKPTYAGIPTSCEDLWRIGHTLSGLYFVMEGKLIKNNYCDFTKLPGDTGFQNLIGYAEIKPKPVYFGIPKSCANLKGTGHTSSGLYSIMGTSKVESVFCDFTKSPSEPAFQTWIGFVDVQSFPVYFYVQRSGDFQGTNNPVTFDVVRINTGGAMNAGNGIFTAPVSGTYFFSFSGIAYMIGTTSDGAFRASLRKNGELIGRAEALMTQGLSTDTFTLQSTLYLQAGQQIWVQPDTEDKMYLHDTGNHYTHFTGWLLQEDVAL